jgi:hypothetical protein
VWKKNMTKKAPEEETPAQKEEGRSKDPVRVEFAWVVAHCRA